MTRFEPARGLDEQVAALFARPAVARVAEEVLLAATQAAPPAKTWKSVGDERVRPAHQYADQQTVPANLRYILPKAEQHDLAAGRDLARQPGDENLPEANRFGCRCGSIQDPGALRQAMHGTPASVAGARVHARVECVFHRVAESEYPDTEDSGGGWMGGAAREVARRHQGTPRV